MPLDPQAKTLLDRLATQAIPSLDSLSPGEARAQMEAATLFLGRPERVANTVDQRIPGPDGPLRIRITYPEGNGPFPVLVYFHGGGWVIGSIETHDGLCKAITNAASVAVASVNYRLAPENKFPAGADDAYAATCWLAEHAGELKLDAARMAVGGDSAGGNLAAVVALKCRDLAGPALRLQLLIYPITDNDLNTRSYIENAEGYMLTRPEMAWFWAHYLNRPEEGANPYASPLRAENVRGLAPAFIMTAEYDPLRDEAEAYAKRLQAANVPVTLSRYDGMIHGFLRRYMLMDQGRKGLEEVARVLAAALA